MNIALVAAGCRFTLLAHGGAGDWEMKSTHQVWYREKFSAALTEGYKVLHAGGTALDGVQATVKALEDSGALNAGKGAVRTKTGGHELDASLMDGQTRKAGAVASVRTIKNPIEAARRVMEKTWHVMLVGSGAESFAAAEGLPVVDASYFKPLKPEDWEPASIKGTVGAVALDCHGNLAAATSTGGLEGKLPGRVGDSPIIGAGTYANDQVAVSATGDGEYFIRVGVARDIAAQVEYGGTALKSATESTLAKVKRLGGTGGVIALDAKGALAASHNTEGMLHGWIREDGKATVEFR